jgi:hypothetical protein
MKNWEIIWTKEKDFSFEIKTCLIKNLI